MSEKTALLFSGQGSQYTGMAAGIIDSYPAAAELAATANQILGYDLIGIMRNGPDDVLRETRYTQPALFLHETIILRLLKDVLAVDAVAGHSLGEFSALYCAGVLDFSFALRIVQRRAELMFETGKNLPGTMAAIIGLDDDVVESICSECSVNNEVVVPANYNSPGQIVISGSVNAVHAAMEKCKQAGARMVTELSVSGAFHSPLMAEAKADLASALHAETFSDARVAVYPNAHATVSTSGDQLRQSAINQLDSPVLWSQTLKAMHESGITKFIEIGPGKVLQGLVKRTLQGVTISGIDTVEQVTTVLKQE